MVRGEKLTDAIKYERVDVLKKDLFAYIDKYSPKINANLPVFFGHIISSLDNAFPDLDDTTYDEFIDAIAYRLMAASKMAEDINFIERICSNAVRSKRKKSGKAVLKILAGLKLMNSGKYQDAINYFSDYWKYDARIGFYIAFCYYELAKEESKKHTPGQEYRPGRLELLAREQLLELARIQPHIFHLRQLDIPENSLMERAFWEMITNSLNWFPSERWFIKVGIAKAKRDKNKEKRVELLKFATERFYNDLSFLREQYNLKLEAYDGIGAASVVKQMMQHHPQSLEPVYYGIKLSLLSSGTSSYVSFRSKALQKGMPLYLLQLLDLGFFLMRGKEDEATIHLRDMKKRYHSLHFYLIPLEYLAQDIFSGDEKRAKQAKQVFFDSLDHYAERTINVQE